MSSNSFLSFVLSNFAFWPLWTSTLLDQHNTVLSIFFFLITVFVFFYYEAAHPFFYVFIFVLVPACNIAMIIFSHYVGVWVCHLILWKSCTYFAFLSFASLLSVVQIWDLHSLASSILLDPLLSCILKLLVMRMFFTSISKFYSLWYLSVAFKHWLSQHLTTFSWCCMYWSVWHCWLDYQPL